MAIDIFTHVLPIEYKNRLYRYSDKFMSEKKIEEKRITFVPRASKGSLESTVKLSPRSGISLIILCLEYTGPSRNCKCTVQSEHGSCCPKALGKVSDRIARCLHLRRSRIKRLLTDGLDIV